MKHISHLLSVALAVLTLTSQAVKADDCQFTPNALPGQATDRTEFEVSATVHVGEGSTASMRYGSMDNLASTNANVVALFRGSAVYFIAAGSADVTYTETVRGRESSCFTDHTIHYTVAKGTPTAYFAGQDGAALTEYNLSLASGGGGDAGVGGGGGGGASTGEGGGTPGYWTPGLVLKIKSYNDGRGTFVEEAVTTGITYASSNPAVAEVDAATGAVTVKGIVGTTTVSATWAGNDDWNGTTVSYTLIVKKQAVMYFSPYYGTDTVGNVLHIAPLISTPGVQVDAYESSNTEVATVDQQGNVTMLHFGNVQIDAVFNGNDEYHPYRCRFYLTVSKRKAHIAFAQANVKLDPQDSPALPALVRPDDMSTDADRYHWRSTNTSVMYINYNTGEWTIEKNSGTTQIQCFFAGDDKYLPDTARCNVEIVTSGIYVLGRYAKASQPDMFGDGSVIYTYNPANGSKYLELDKDTFDANGGVFIESSAFLSILVKRNCVIKNAVKAVNSSSAVFIWCQNRKDSITIHATHSAISAAAVKIHDCYLFANGNQYGIYTNGTITVSAGGYVFAQGATEAIRARQFIKGEDNIGGIEILTKNVSFVSWQEATDNFGGFYLNYPSAVKATFVELGKVPLPVAGDEVTEISFDGEGKNPDENLGVVFSGSEDDTFNEGESQIEISTVTEDAKLSNTLSLYVTCSSDWLKALPGVLVFDVPAGKGTFEIQCQVADGFHIEAMIEGVGAAVISQTKPGWIAVSYEVLEQTHVIVYLQATEPSSAPKRAPAATHDAAPGAVIKAIKITPESVATSIDILESNRGEDGKVLRDGRLYIIRDGRVYTATGARVQ